MECFAFGGATVRFASLKTSFHAANHSTNDRCEALASLKGCFLCFCFSPQYFSTEPKSIFTTKNIKYET